MNTRKIHTKIWQDDTFSSYSKNGKILFLYLLTNPKIGFTGMFECSDRVILFDTGLTKNELEDTKIELSRSCSFYQGWVFVKKAQDYDPIKGKKNTLLEALSKEEESIPLEIFEYFNAPSIPLTENNMDHTGTIDGLKVMVRERKGERVPREGDELSEEFCLTTAQEMKLPVSVVRKTCSAYLDYVKSTGKKYKSKQATVRNWLRRDIGSGKLIPSQPYSVANTPRVEFVPVDPIKAKELIQKARDQL